MKKITKKIEQSIVVIALSLTQITTPILVIAETSEADQPAETTSKIDKEKDPILASSEKEASSFTSSTSSQEEVATSSSEENEVDQSEETSGIKDSSVAETETNKSSTNPKIAKKEENASRSNRQIKAQELLKKGTLLTMADEEYSQTQETRVLNNTPVKLKLDFEIIDEDYLAGTTVVFSLPDTLGFTDNQGTIQGIDATWQVDSANRQVTITFNQAMHDATFSLELKSYLYSESTPQIKVTIDDLNKTSYAIDLYEDVESLKYEQQKNIFGLDGTVYYNLDRKLSGTETLSLQLMDTPGAVFKKIESQPLKVYSYDVDIKGNIKPETQTELVAGTDYTITANDLQNTAVEIKQMDQQKAYGVVYQFTMSLSEISDHQYSYYKNYPTTGFGSVNLEPSVGEYRGISFVAKTSQTEKEISSKYYSAVAGGNLYSNEKGSYYLTLHGMPTEMKKGQQITISAENGQELTVKQLMVNDAFYQNVPLDEYFKVENSNGTLTLTAIKDSNLAFSMIHLTVPFDQKDIVMNITTPLIPNEKFKVIGDDYVQPISVLYPNSAETAWGNYNQNGAYANDTSVNVEGSTTQPVENLKIFVEHPDYLTLRKVPEVNYYYKIDQDYRIEKVEGGTLVTFITPINRSIQFDIGFNYVPDSLASTTRIPVDKIPVSISADGLDTVDTTVTTGRKNYSEQTLQGSKNQFLVNARQDTIKDLKVETHVPINTDVVFSIIDVSNDQVDGMIYPQYWDRGQYNTQVMKESDPNYPTITHDEATNYYTFDFRTTDHRYIIAYHYANGWQETKSILIPGFAKEPLYGNQQGSSTVTVSNTETDIIDISQRTVTSAKNVTQVTVKTKNIDDGTKKVVNPTFSLKSIGNTNGEIDPNSIRISNVPDDSYKVEKVNGEIRLVFANYVLKENVEISYTVLSQNAGQISASATISSETIDTLSEAKRTATSTVANLQFSAGDSEGIIYKTSALLDVFDTEMPTKKIAGVSLMLINQLTGTVINTTTDQVGESQLTDIYTGKYKVYVSKVPEGYVVPEDIQSGMDVQVNRTGNQISIGITPEKDLSSISVKDSTLYVGDTWQAEDNFVSATDKKGNNVSFSEVTVSGDVDTSKTGSYQVTYTNGTAKSVATITVVSDQATVVAKDSTLYVGDQWQAEDNFVSATDKDGKAVSFADVTVTGTVDTTTPGKYEVSYHNGKVEAVATITVLADQTSVKAKDSTLYVGDTWQAEDNFVSATDKQGNNVTFSEVTVSGDVDTSKAGSYQVTYKNGNAESVATITVVSDQATVVAKDSTLYVGDQWQVEDNFVSATDKDGKAVSIADVTVTGTVDTTTPGKYEVSYHNGKVEAVATITVLADQTSVKAKDSTLYVGDTWQAEDNFVSATDKDGKALSIADVTVSGDVDTSKAGSYQVTYKNGNAESVATITVVSDQPTVVAKDSTLYVGDQWQVEDNFVSATDKDGKAVSFADVIVTGTVDTTTPGKYEVSYHNGKVEAVATITVLADQTSVVVKDSVLYVGDPWQPENNFVSATDRDGNPFAFERLFIEGSVDTDKVGTYQVSYSLVSDDKEANRPSLLERLFGTTKQLAVTATATIQVIEKQPATDDGKSPHNNQTKPVVPKQNDGSKPIKATAKDRHKRVLPKTGSSVNPAYPLVGLTFIGLVAGIIVRRKKKAN
ncbi:bacterial Ig-like domain-containing protein [Enterococcus gallinarum]|uniref:bacterial Ig-like domain-containing protein n=1 Tax=Enterococcus gallinarum TaxID=1353 RepID=UPI002B1CE023|nr:bacterial Ig-like domain-containing protein [Enterococcus gallinarum]